MSKTPAACPSATESLPRQNGTPPVSAFPIALGVPVTHPQPTPDIISPVNQDGCFEFDRVLKCGYVQKRTKTKTWKTAYLVMRPNTISIYKSDKEDKLRCKIYLSELTAVTLLRDPKQKRQNVFGLFSPAKNFYFEAATALDAQCWVDIVRRDARIEEEEEEIFLASPIVRHPPSGSVPNLGDPGGPTRTATEQEQLLSSSPEPPDTAMGIANAAGRIYTRQDLTVAGPHGYQHNDLVTHSDLSDVEPPSQSIGASAESLKIQPPSVLGPHHPRFVTRNTGSFGVAFSEQDPDRVIWQGSLWLLRGKGGLKQWKKSWTVLRPRNLILYRDSSEYSPHLVVPLSSILSVVDLDPISRNKRHCLQVITEEKRFRFCALDEESLLQCLGAFKSLLARRKELEARAAAITAVESPSPLAVTTDLPTPSAITTPSPMITLPMSLPAASPPKVKAKSVNHQW